MERREGRHAAPNSLTVLTLKMRRAMAEVVEHSRIQTASVVYGETDSWIRALTRELIWICWKQKCGTLPKSTGAIGQIGRLIRL